MIAIHRRGIHSLLSMLVVFAILLFFIVAILFTAVYVRNGWLKQIAMQINQTNRHISTANSQTTSELTNSYANHQVIANHLQNDLNKLTKLNDLLERIHLGNQQVIEVSKSFGQLQKGLNQQKNAMNLLVPTLQKIELELAFYHQANGRNQGSAQDIGTGCIYSKKQRKRLSILQTQLMQIDANQVIIDCRPFMQTQISYWKKQIETALKTMGGKLQISDNTSEKKKSLVKHTNFSTSQKQPLPQSIAQGEKMRKAKLTITIIPWGNILIDHRDVFEEVTSRTFHLNPGTHTIKTWCPTLGEKTISVTLRSSERKSIVVNLKDKHNIPEKEISK